ncbi:hypothetical protein ACROYT_G038820 [Oculina patagonica]
MSESAGVAITAVLTLLVIINIMGNSLVCTIIKRNRDMRTPINYLLVNLAIADIVYAAFIAPKGFFKLTSVHHPDGMTGLVLCKLLTGGNVAWVGAVCSAVNLVAIAIERYYAVMYPYGNKWKLTKRKLKVIIPGSWVFAAIVNVPLFLAKNTTEKKGRILICKPTWPEVWMEAPIMIWSVVVGVSLAMMIVLYSRVVYALWFKSNDENSRTNQQQGVMKVRKRVTLMVVVVTVIFGICWGVNQVIHIFKFFSSYTVGALPTVVANTMVLVNSAVNPFVFALLNQQFREKMKEMICCTDCTATRVHSEPGSQDVELADNTKHKTNLAGPSSME